MTVLYKNLSRLLLIVGWLCFGVSVATAEMGPEPKAREARPRIFSLIAAGASTVQTLSSDFSQEKHLAMLKEPLASSGKLAYEKPDRLYWEVLKPTPAGFVVLGDRARRWKSDRVSETLEIEQDPMIKAIVEQVFAWARADFPWLEKRYRIIVLEETPTLLKLLPLNSREKKFLAYITVAFSEDHTHVRSVELHERGGDVLRLRFLNTLLNPPLAKDLFEK